MFVRQKPNRSGSVSVQVIDKANGYRVVKTMGSSKDPEQIGRLVELGELFIARHSGQYSLFPADQQGNALALDVIRTLQNAFHQDPRRGTHSRHALRRDRLRRDS